MLDGAGEPETLTLPTSSLHHLLYLLPSPPCLQELRELQLSEALIRALDRDGDGVDRMEFLIGMLVNPSLS